MRKIEQEMLGAIAFHQSWKQDNTEVVVSEDKTKASIYLHGNHIATKVYGQEGVSTNLQTLRRYPSNTTKSRLRALGVDVCHSKGELLLNGEKLL